MGVSADLTIWIAFSAGILSFFSPCVLPLVPSYLTYITGLSFNELDEEQGAVRLKVFTHALIFISGFSIIFILMGALAGSFQGVLQQGLGWIQKIGGVLVIGLGIHMSGLFRFNFLLREKRAHVNGRSGGYLSTFFIGLAFAAGWTPCIGPILGGILAMAAGTSADTTRGTLLLAVYSAGLGIPFLLSAVLFHHFLGFFNRFKSHIRTVEIVTGILLILVGILLFFNLFARLSGLLYQLFPG